MPGAPEQDRLVGECTAVNEDLEKDIERQPDVPAAPQYGALGPAKAAGEPALRLGGLAVTPALLWKGILALYVANFIVRRLADLLYLCTVDARFPHGLGYLYPSEEERQQSVRYTQLTVLTSMGFQIVKFSCVMVMVRFQLFAKMDELLKAAIASSKECCGRWLWCGCLDSSCMRAVRDFTDFLARLCAAIFCCPCRCCGLNLSWARIFRGAVYLTLVAAFFLLVSLPFRRVMYQINVAFGFTNTISITPVTFYTNIVNEFESLFVFSLPMKILFLTVLSCRFGWLFMWVSLVCVTYLAQANFKSFAPQILGLKNAFPNDVFAVGRGFPFASVPNPALVGSDWVDLNRIYYRDPYSPTLKFSTSDNSKGALDLYTGSSGTSGQWTIAAQGAPAGTAPYAESAGSVSDLKRLGDLAWRGKNQAGRVGIRSGDELRAEVMALARRRNIGVGEIYMVDGSSKDIRANAFVGGFGKQSVIGLYDTLFLGERTSIDMNAASSASSFQQLPTELASAAEVFMQHMSDNIQDVDSSDDAEPQKPVRNAPTQAMTDAEIVSILAHEFGHADLGHLYDGMGVSAVTSFLTFAALGFMAHSSVVAAALALPYPVVHVGALAYDYVAGPALNGVLKPLSDARVRHAEYEADAYAAEVSERYATGLQTALAKATINSNQDPMPPWFYDALHADHPSYGRRWAHIESVKRARYGR